MYKIFDLQKLFLDKLTSLYHPNEIKSLLKLLLEFYYKEKITDLISKNLTITKAHYDKITQHLETLEKGCPIHHIIGTKEFYNCSFFVNNKVLIPRGETEELVQWVLESARDNQKILDLCTGSGCIAISLAKHRNCKLFAIDISDEALNIARRNSKENNVMVDFYKKDVLKDDFSFLEEVNIIVSNPPYVLNSQKKYIKKNVLNFEPHLALFVDDSNPLIFYEKILTIAKNKLIKNGFIFFEINELFEKEIYQLILEKGFKNIYIKKDIHGKSRLVKAQLL